MGRKSPFEAGFLVVELYYGGAWHDVTDDVAADGVTITRGRSDEGSRVDPSTCALSLLNTTGEYSPRNPSSSLYGLIGRGTPIRVATNHGTTTHGDRFLGEVVEWPQRWGMKGAPSVYSPIVAAGALRRIGQGASALSSPLRRTLTALGSDLVGYWPMEDATDSTQVEAVLGTTATVTGAPSFAGYDGFAASAPLLTLQDAKVRAVVPGYTPTSPASVQVRWLAHIPAGTTNDLVLLRVVASGTLGYVEIRYRTAGGGGIFIDGIDDEGVSAGSAAWGFGSGLDDTDVRFSLEMTQNGADIDVTVSVIEAGATSGFFNSGSFAAVTLGTIRTVEFNPLQASFGDVAIGHLTVERDITSLFTVSPAVLAGHAGERADERIARLLTENGITSTSIGDGDLAELMGPQGIATLPALLDEAATTGGGILFEPRDAEGVAYRELDSLYSQTPKMTVTYTDNLLLPFEPVEDDQGTRNVVTVTRSGGSSATVEETDGPLGTDAVGVYDEAVTLSLDTDSQVADQAGWRVHLGTVDEARWPVIGFDLAHPTFLASDTLTDDVLSLDLGDRLDVTDLPAWLPPDDVSVLLQGYTETIGTHHHRIEFNCSPARPYAAAYYTDADHADRWSADGTVTAEDLDATETGVDITPPTGAAWGHDTGDYDVLIDGERMTVTAVTAPGTSQTFTVTRSVNGVSRTHTAGAAVTLAEPSYYGL